jgi:phage gp36-like protein
MPFLLRSDYDQLIRADLLNVVTDASDLIRSRAELAAIQEMQSYLRGRYDLEKIFIDVLPWAQARQYAKGAVVVYLAPAAQGKPAGEALLYVARFAHKGVAPVPTDTPDVLADFEAAQLEAALEAQQKDIDAPQLAPDPGPAWVQLDPRNAYLLLLLVDLTLYHVHSRNNPSKIPDLRRDRYDMALDWLKSARAGKMSTGLPPAPVTLPDGQDNPQNIRPRGGSLQKLNNSY